MDNIKTGQFIKELRNEKNLTQKELAQQLHITDRAVSKWERGLCAPDIALLEPLAEILDVSITELLQGERAQKQDENLLKEEYAQYVLEYFKIELARKIKAFRRKFLMGFGICVMIAIITFVGVLWQKGYFYIVDRSESRDGKYKVTVYDKDISRKGLFKEDGIYVVSEDTTTGEASDSFYGDCTYVDHKWSPFSKKFLLQLEKENEPWIFLHHEEENTTRELSSKVHRAIEKSKLREKRGHSEIEYRFWCWHDEEEMIFEYTLGEEEGTFSYNCVTGQLHLLPKGAITWSGNLWNLSNINEEIATGSSLGVDAAYTFKKASPQNLPKSRQKIRGLYENENEKKNSLFVGQVITLFGGADDIAQSSEKMCSWTVCAKDNLGKEIYLEIYYGIDGPAISGPDSEEYKAAANELAELIMSAEAEDYHFEWTFEELPEIIHMEVLAGFPSYEVEMKEDASQVE